MDARKDQSANEAAKREAPKTFRIEKLEKRIAPSATVLHADLGVAKVHAVLTPSGNLNAHAHL